MLVHIVIDSGGIKWRIDLESCLLNEWPEFQEMDKLGEKCFLYNFCIYFELFFEVVFPTGKNVARVIIYRHGDEIASRLHSHFPKWGSHCQSSKISLQLMGTGSG